MKQLLYFTIILALTSCNGNKIPEAPHQSKGGTKEAQLMNVSFEFGSQKEGIVTVFYTNDNDSLFLNKEWVKAVKAKMKNLSSDYANVLLFNSKENTPDVTTKGMGYSEKYDKHMVCGF